VDTGIPQGFLAAPSFAPPMSGIFNEVEIVVPGVRGALFVDGIAWWVEEKDYRELGAKRSEAVAAFFAWAVDNGIAISHGKTEAAFF